MCLLWLITDISTASSIEPLHGGDGAQMSRDGVEMVRAYYKIWNAEWNMEWNMECRCIIKLPVPDIRSLLTAVTTPSTTHA